MIVSCAQADSSKNAVAQTESFASMAPVWRPLAHRLIERGLNSGEVIRLLASLPNTPTQSPMGRKVRELYNKTFFPTSKSRPSSPYYKGVVNQANAQLCRQFIHEHEAAFNDAYEKYGVPPAIGSALLFVETRLGKVLADIPENAFYTLASMAVCTNPDDISTYLPKLSGYEKRLPWFRETMQKRANWAFNETAALMEHMIRDGITQDRLPGSIYGAVGLCQFMPSNISVYGADGDKDGKIDLFNASDAIASLSNYLYRHGWKKNLPLEREHKILMTYNHSTVYANTILALGKLILNPSLTGEETAKAPRKTRSKK